MDYITKKKVFILLVVSIVLNAVSKGMMIYKQYHSIATNGEFANYYIINDFMAEVFGLLTILAIVLYIIFQYFEYKYKQNYYSWIILVGLGLKITLNTFASVMFFISDEFDYVYQTGFYGGVYFLLPLIVIISIIIVFIVACFKGKNTFSLRPSIIFGSYLILLTVNTITKYFSMNAQATINNVSDHTSFMEAYKNMALPAGLNTFFSEVSGLAFFILFALYFTYNTNEKEQQKE